jgi:ubiquinone/menaquinone biosynthesis C-methylase UbiE
VGGGIGFFAIAQMVGSRGRVIAVDLQQQMLGVLLRRAIYTPTPPLCCNIWWAT